MQSLAEHVGPLVSVLSLGWIVAAVVLWHAWRDRGRKLDDLTAALRELVERICDRVDWDTFNHHKHNGDGSMVHGNDCKHH